MRLAAAAVFLLTAAVPDIKTKKIPVWIPAVFLSAALAGDLFLSSHMTGRDLLAGVMPGAGLLAASAASGKKVGEGDGICLAVCGLLTGLQYTVFIASAALMLAGLTGLFCIWAGIRKADDKIAFVPFLAVSAVGLLISESVAFWNG